MHHSRPAALSCPGSTPQPGAAPCCLTSLLTQPGLALAWGGAGRGGGSESESVSESVSCVLADSTASCYPEDVLRRGGVGGTARCVWHRPRPHPLLPCHAAPPSTLGPSPAWARGQAPSPGHKSQTPRGGGRRSSLTAAGSSGVSHHQPHPPGHSPQGLAPPPGHSPGISPSHCRVARGQRASGG